jgi:hypothetical protein
MGAKFVARWDLDKTYLRTDFDTMRDLVRTAIERPDRKRSVPGAAALLRELGKTGARIHILSGSPRQMRGRLEEKLLIDRVRWDELTLKPNLSNLMRLRLRAMRDQLGYKLPMLLQARARDQKLGDGPGTPREILVGDDAEADAFVYSLFADIVEGGVSRALLARVLERGRVYDDQAEACLRAFDAIDHGSAVGRILIHLDRQTPPSRFADYGERVVPFYNYLQAAFVLAEDGCIPPAAALRVASELVVAHRFEPEALARSYRDLLRRRHVRGSAVSSLATACADLEGLPTRGQLRRMCELLSGYAAEASEPAETSLHSELDYLELAQRHRGGRQRRHPPE